MNATFSDAVVSFSKVSNHLHEVQKCNELTFVVTAVSQDHNHFIELESFSVIGGFLPSKYSSLYMHS